MKTVLFIGNSFTFYHDMPAAVSAKLEQAGCPHQVESFTKGGWFLSRYADPQDKYGALLRERHLGKHWDILILQDQSFNPVDQYEDFLAGAKALKQLLQPEKVLMYQTWAYEEAREELMIAMEGICMMAEFAAKLKGIPVERMTDTKEWIAKYSSKWEQKNKPCELAKITEMFEYLDTVK